MKKQKVYTFYEPIDKWDSSKLLLDLWLENWSSKGFEPIVLNESDAKSHPYYTEYDKLIRSNYEKISGRNIMTSWSHYIYYCFIRHLAFANKMTDEISIAMDYDIYNINYKHEILSTDKITFFNGQNPCCISGNKHLFLDLCLLMSKFTEANKDVYKRTRNDLVVNGRPAFHDLGWIRVTDNLPHPLPNALRDKVTFGNVARIRSTVDDNIKSLIHVSFYWLQEYIKAKGEENYEDNMTVDQRYKLRYELAKKQLEL